MSFQIKTFIDIVLAQINHGRLVTDKITDWAPGSVARTLVEAPAVEIEELYIQMFLGLRDAIPVATFMSFGFDRLPAARAHGFVSISKSPAPTLAITIPIGTAFSTADGRVYTSTATVTWGSGQTVARVPVVCSEAGLIGNAAAGVINTSDAFASADGYTVGNALIDTGRDLETDSEREARFTDFVQSLSRGTVVACLYAARQSVVLDADGNRYEYVTRAGLSETPGRVRIYLYGNRGTASADLLADGQLRIDGTRDDEAGTITPGYRAAGVRVDVLPMVERAVSLAVAVEMFDGYALTPAVEQDLQDAFAASLAAALPGQTLYLGTLVEAMLAEPGVSRIVPASNANILCAVDEALTPGTLTVTAL